jgi:hypothetical protein
MGRCYAAMVFDAQTLHAIKQQLKEFAITRDVISTKYYASPKMSCKKLLIILKIIAVG